METLGTFSSISLERIYSTECLVCSVPGSPLQEMHLKKGYEGVFVLVAIGFWWLMSQTLCHRWERIISIFLTIWSVGSSADNYFTEKNHWLLTSSHTFSMETNTFHDPEKATSLYTQSNVLFFPQKMSSPLFLLQLKLNTVALECGTFLLTA